MVISIAMLNYRRVNVQKHFASGTLLWYQEWQFPRVSFFDPPDKTRHQPTIKKMKVYPPFWRVKKETHLYVGYNYEPHTKENASYIQHFTYVCWGLTKLVGIDWIFQQLIPYGQYELLGHYEYQLISLNS